MELLEGVEAIYSRGGLILVDSAQIRILIVLCILFRNFYVLPKLKANRDGAGQKSKAR